MAMMRIYLYLHQFNLVAVTLRLFLSMLLGAFIGMERERKGYAAGLRTHMLVCIGAALTVLISQYDFYMMHTQWAEVVQRYHLKIDISRYSAQVINGIGFLGAGTIIVNRKQEVKGISTAAGLWASGCMGIVIGAGFYECMVFAFLMILSCNLFFSKLSSYIVDKSRNMNIFVEFGEMNDLRTILSHIQMLGIHIYDVDVERGHRKRGLNPNAVFLLKLPRREGHAQVLEAIMELESVIYIDEI